MHRCTLPSKRKPAIDRRLDAFPLHARGSVPSACWEKPASISSGQSGNATSLDSQTPSPRGAASLAPLAVNDAAPSRHTLTLAGTDGLRHSPRCRDGASRHRSDRSGSPGRYAGAGARIGPCPSSGTDRGPKLSRKMKGPTIRRCQRAGRGEPGSRRPDHEQPEG